MAVRKIINRNKPEKGDNAQYNYESGYITGIRNGNELYSLVENQTADEEEYADLWPSGGIGVRAPGSLTIDYVGIRRLISNRKSYRNRYFLLMLDDDKETSLKNIFNNSGDYRTNALSTINSLTDIKDDDGWSKKEAQSALRQEYCNHNGCNDGGTWGDHHWGSDYNPPCLFGYDCDYDLGGNYTQQGTSNDIPNFPLSSGTPESSDYWNITDWSLIFGQDAIQLANEMAYAVDTQNKPESYFYFIFYAHANHYNWAVNRSRQYSYTVYRLPKADLWSMWNNPQGESKVIAWTNDTQAGDDIVYPLPTYITGGSGWAPQWAGGDLRITIQGPPDNAFELYSEDGTWVDLNLEDEFNPPNYFELNPINKIDYFSSSATGGDDGALPNMDFRPMSFVNVKNTSKEYDLQSFYTFPKNLYTSAPATVELSFRIAENLDLWYPQYIGYNYQDHEATTYEVFEEGDDGGDGTTTILPITDQFYGLRFMFYVFDWDAEDMELEWYGDNGILNDIPGDIPQLFYKQNNFNTYFYQDLYNDDGTYNPLEHSYSEPGIKIIKAVVFSYSTNSAETHIQGIRWRAVALKLFINIDAAFIQDFSDLDGSDFTYLPWPRTTPIISGISDDSQYSNSLHQIIQKNLFGDTELLEESLAYDAYDNLQDGEKNELGDYLGKCNIAQLRYFNEVYSMNELLMLDTDDPYVNYDEIDAETGIGEWYCHQDECSGGGNEEGSPDNPKWPTESCVGMIFINDNIHFEDDMGYHKDKRDDCVLELNMANTTQNGLIRDSSGHGFKAVLIGDYTVTKNAENSKSVRDSEMDAPKTNNNDKAF